MKIMLNDCHLCGKDCGSGMVGFDEVEMRRGEPLQTLYVCLTCKVNRDGQIPAHPNLAMPGLTDEYGPRNEG